MSGPNEPRIPAPLGQGVVNYPSFRLLLYLEWLLLATAALMEVLHPFQSLWSLLLRVGAIALFGAIGLRLPTVGLGRKVLFTAL